MLNIIYILVYSLIIDYYCSIDIYSIIICLFTSVSIIIELII